MIILFPLFAELERDLISLRTKEALVAKKLQEGILLGKPKGTIQKSKFDTDLERIKGLLRLGLSVRKMDEMRRVASSIRHGTVSASLLMRKRAAYPRQNQVARALTELGKLERTLFLLEYFRNEALHRRILIGLNKGKALHALARQIFFGRLGELRDRALEDQIHRASCLHFLMTAITAWNTVSLAEAIAQLRRQARGDDPRINHCPFRAAWVGTYQPDWELLFCSAIWPLP